MGILDIFKKPTIIEDDFFGKLRFRKTNDSENSYFEGKGLFGPTGKEIEFIIKGKESGPELKQKEFYNWVQENYRELITRLTPLVEEEFGNWKESFKIKNFDKEFKLVGITIPRHCKTTMEWDISFDTIHDENHQVTVDFIGKEPQGVLIDG
ncbi:hypothetical protein [Rufibacter hautae]|uniref:DUF2262 domain-containing protein n=1 Tax=Rufibacter hautae TaxID=2595005 RepID=A0A5B6TB62_9BACT|nr:hypothetical protein [Rufibacter hautae]KAA3436830.1 hypothetical protein FOA19_20870 [Rufibacter hautae]